MTYTMDIETADGISQHPFHLGTDYTVARQFALEALKREGVRSVAIRGDKGKLVEILDHREFDADAYAQWHNVADQY